MKINYLLFFLIITMPTCLSQIVNIPDSNFKTALLNHDPVIDINSDGEIQISEANNFSSGLNIIGQSITDLTGIEEFTSINQLSADNNNIATIDLTNNSLLTFIDIQGNNLTSINLSNNDLLEVLSVGENPINSIDISTLNNLKQFYADQCDFKELDTSNNLLLELLIVSQTPLISLDLSQNPNLTNSVDCFMCGNLTSLNLQNGNGGSMQLDISQSTNIECVQIDSNLIGNIPSNWNYEPGTNFSDDCMFLSSDNFETQQISLYPNPATSYLLLESISNRTVRSTIIYNLSGQKFTARLQNGKIDISNLSAGLYLLTLQTNKGTTTKKFIKY